MLEGGGDVVLDLLELAADALHPVQGGGVGDLADRRHRGFHRGAGGAAALGEVGQRILEPGRAQRERLEPFVAGVQEALDGLVAGEQRDDALLLRARVGAPGTPDLAGDLAHQGGRLFLDGQEAVGEAFVHGAFDRRGDAHLTGGHAWFVFVLLESTQQSPGCPGVLREAVGPYSSMTSLAIWGRRGVRREEHRARPGATHVSAAGKTRGARRRFSRR